jgi:hypothetical protein
MRPRMHCADCGATGFAHTRLEGSDWIEIAGWLLGGLPGWLYCAWRHALRAKICARCGSDALLREARAAAASRPPDAAPSFGARIECHSGTPLWPHPLHEPRARLRRGLLWLAAWTLAAAGLPGAGTLLATAVVALEIARDAQLRFGPRRCRAWDALGRPLRIELA